MSGAVGGWLAAISGRFTDRFRARRPEPRPAHPPFRRKYLVEALEPRVLLSADLPVIPPPAPDPLPPEAPAVSAAFASGGEAPPDFHFDASEFAAGAAAALAPEAFLAGAPTTEIAFVDSRVVGQDALTVERDGLMVVVLDANEDGIAQISEVLARYQGLQAVHLLAHGSEGQMLLGNAALDSAAVSQGQVDSWGRSISDSGDLTLYGCDVAGGELGVSFVRELARATGADVAASTNPTGTGARGGDWSLEFATGPIEALAPFSPASLAGYEYLLANVDGTSGDDTLVFGTDFTWGDTVDGLAGTDTLSFAGSVSALTFTIGAGGSITVSDGVNSVSASHIESLTGGDGADTFKFQNDATLAGTIAGGGGSDTLDFALYVDAGDDLAFGIGNTAGQVGVAGAVSLATGIENLRGGAGDDVFTFGSSAALAGTLDGGGGENELNYASYSTGVTVDLATGSATGVAGAAAAKVSNIQNVTGSAQADSLTGNAQDNTLTGNGGNDTFGFADDWGDDTVVGGAGTDTLDFSAATNGVEFTIGTGGAAGAEGGTGELAATTIENLTGTQGDDTFFTGENGRLNGNLDAGAGDDTIDLSEKAGSFVGASLTGHAATGSVSNYESVQHPALIVAGVEGLFEFLQDALLDVVEEVSLPFIGDVGGNIGSFLTTLETAVVAKFNEKLLASGANLTKSTDELIEEAFNEGFSLTPANGLTVTVSVNGIAFEMELTGNIWSDDVPIDFSIGVPGLGLEFDDGSELHVSLDYAFHFGGGIDFNTGEFYFEVGGFDDDPLTQVDEGGKSFILSLTALLNAGFEGTAVLGFLELDFTEMTDGDGHSGVSGAFTIEVDDVDGDGRLTFTEIGDAANPVALITARLEASADIDFEAVVSANILGDGVLPQIEFFFHYDQDFANATINADTGIDFAFGKPMITFEDVTLDLGTFISNFLGPIFEQIQVFTEPLQPIVDLLKYPIPILSDFAVLRNFLNQDGDANIDLMDIAGTLLGQTKYASVVKAINALADLIDIVNSIPTDGNLEINFGTFVIGGPDDATDARAAGGLKNGGNPGSAGGTAAFDNSVNGINDGGNPDSDAGKKKSFLQKLKGSGPDGFKVPLLTSPSAVIGLLMGKDVDLFTYTMPILDFDFDFRKSFSVVFPLNVVMHLGAGATVRLGFGYDTYGIKQFLDSGDPADIFDGFYVKDWWDDGNGNLVDLPEVEVHAITGLGASIGISGIVEAGVEGGITANIEFNLNDVDWTGVGGPDLDGKIRIEDFEKLFAYAPLAFLDMSGSLEWYLQAFVWVGLDLGFFGKITLYDETFDLGGGVLFEFDSHYDVAVIPDVASLSGGTLLLHMGQDASLRGGNSDGDLAEGYSIVRVANNVNDDHDLDAYNFDGAADPDSVGSDLIVVTFGGYSEAFAAGSVTKILARGAGDGKDVVTVGEGISAEVELHGGDGKDNFSVLSSGVVRLYGDEGDDKLKSANASSSYVFGGGGKDKITVKDGYAEVDAGDGDDAINTGAGNDLIDGGDGNDVINSDGGNDVVHGGAGNDKIKTAAGTDTVYGDGGDDTIDAGADNDLVYGGDAAGANSGADIIKGGDGDDVVFGGDEAGVTAQGKAIGDTIEGGLGKDTIYGGKGADVLRGDNADGTGNGNDVLHGGDGDDTLTGGLGQDAILGEGDNDTIYWRVGDGVDSGVTAGATWLGGHTAAAGIDAGAGNQKDADGVAVLNGGNPVAAFDSFVVTGDNGNTAITMTPSGADVRLDWGANSLLLVGVEKFSLNAGTGQDAFVINDLRGTTAREVGMSLGSIVTDVTQYDYDNDGNFAEGELPPQLQDATGVPIFDKDGNPVYADTYPAGHPDANDEIPYKIVRQTVADPFADSVVIKSTGSPLGEGDDQFTGETSNAPQNPGSTVLNISRSGTADITYSVSQSDAARDVFSLTSGGGDDSIDFSAVTTKVFSAVAFDSGDDDDTVFGTQFADTIDSGLGDDKVSGNAGLDVFVDAGGTDTLSEVNHGNASFQTDANGNVIATGTSSTHFNLTGANFTLDGDAMTIAHALATETEDISMFEEVSLVAGSGNNSFTLQNWAKDARLDGSDGSDTYSIHVAGSGAGTITENDTGDVPGDVDRIFIYGTAGADHFGFTANNDDDDDPLTAPVADIVLTDGSVAVLHDNNTPADPDDDSVESFNYTHGERLEVRGGAGDDVFVVDDNALSMYVYGETGGDSFIVGRVTDSEIDPATGALIAKAVTNGVSFESFLYGDFGEDGNGAEIKPDPNDLGRDDFEVNHNLAPVWLYGNYGDDHFAVNAVLVRDPNGVPVNGNNVSGGSGTNTISYLQNAPVNIDGGSGNDIVTVNGTGLGDTFIVAVVMEDDDPDPGVVHLVAKQKVFGAGLQINMKNIERLEVNGLGGDDFIHVFSTLPEMEVVVSGGAGDDTIHVAGNRVSIAVDPPEYTIDPPAYVYDAPAYIEHWDSVTWSWGGNWVFDWNSFPFLFRTPIISYTWWYPVWRDPAPVTIDPPPQRFNPDPFAFEQGPLYALTGIQGKLTIDGGRLDDNGLPNNDDDRVVVSNQDGSLTGRLTSGDHDDEPISPDVGYLQGLGMTRSDGAGGAVEGGLYYLNVESLEIYLNDDAASADDFMIDYTDPATATTVFAGAGNDTIRVKTASGIVQLDGGEGDDTFNVWDDRDTLDGIAGTLRINGGAGADAVNVSDAGDTADDFFTLTETTLTGANMAGTIEYGPFSDQTFDYRYYDQGIVPAVPPATVPTIFTNTIFTSHTLSYDPVETLRIELGSGSDRFDIEGTQAVTTLNGNDGDDVFNVSSDGAALAGTLDHVTGALALHLGSGDNALNVSDRGDADADANVVITDSAIAGLAPVAISYDAAGGRFAGGVNIWAGRGGDSIALDSTVAGDVTTVDANAGDDQVTLAAGQAADLIVVRGGDGGDQLDASLATQPLVLFGDDGEEIYSTSTRSFMNLVTARSVNPGTGGVDALTGGSTVLIAFGGAAGDVITGGGANDVLVGDDGTASFAAGIVTSFASLGASGGDDEIDAGGGRNYIVGGAGGDLIDAGSGDDVVLGDNGTVNYTPAGVITDAASSDLAAGGVDTITAGEGRNVVIGGAAADGITAGAGDDVLVGDNASVTWNPATGFVTRFASLGTDGGDDGIAAGEGRNLVLGGVGADGVSAGAGDDVVLGDNGVANFTAGGVIADAASTDLAAGGIDTITAGEGKNVVIGGAAGDGITAGTGDDVLVGDNASVTWNPATGFVTRFGSLGIDGGDDSIAAGEGRNLVLGGVGADGVGAGAGDDVVLGDNGVADFTAAGVVTDVTSGDLASGGIDAIAAGEGNNIVVGGSAGDALSAGSGNDVLVGDNASVTWTAGIVTQFMTLGADGGGDTLAGGEGDNVLIGGAGADAITAGAGSDTILGDNGRALYTAAGVITLFETTDAPVGAGDTITAGAGRNIVAGGNSGDAVTTLGGDDLIIGDNGRFTFSGGVLAEAVTTDLDSSTGGNDLLAAGEGDNVVLGGVGNDSINTGAGDDVIIGDNGVAQYDPAGALMLVEARDPQLAGDDAIDADGGDDVVLGGSGSDTITGGAGDDVLLGDGGTATFDAGSLTMVVGSSGGGAADVILGGGGNDILLGGFGSDTMEANLAEDIFTGDNARISFLNGRVTNIELLGEPDLVLQKLFELYSGGAPNESFIIAGNEPEGYGEQPGGQALPEPDLTGSGSLVFSFGRGEPLARIPDLLRNMVLELYLGQGGAGPSHAGETGVPPLEAPPGPTAAGGEDAGIEAAALPMPEGNGDGIASIQLPSAAASEQYPTLGLAALLGAQLVRQGAGGSRSGVLERAPFEAAGRQAFAARGIDW